jgi:hypothetical protein
MLMLHWWETTLYVGRELRDAHGLDNSRCYLDEKRRAGFVSSLWHVMSIHETVRTDHQVTGCPGGGERHTVCEELFRLVAVTGGITPATLLSGHSRDVHFGRNAMTLAARCDDPKFFDALWKMMDADTRARWLSSTDHSQGSPLDAVACRHALSGVLPLAQHQLFDERGAFLAARVPAEVLNRRDKDGRSALYYAIRTGYPKIIRALAARIVELDFFIDLRDMMVILTQNYDTEVMKSSLAFLQWPNCPLGIMQAHIADALLTLQRSRLRYVSHLLVALHTAIDRPNTDSDPVPLPISSIIISYLAQEFQ